MAPNNSETIRDVAPRNMHIQHIEIPTVIYAWYLLFRSTGPITTAGGF